MESDGSVVCWGNGGSGRLGNNSTANSNVPVNTLDVAGESQLSLSGGFATSGTFTSAAINLNNEVGLYSLSLGLTEPSNTSIKLELRTASSEIGLDSASWFGPSGSGIYFSDSSYSLDPSISLSSYVQYRATLETSNSSVTPSLGLIELDYQSFDSSGFLISSPYDSQTDETFVSGLSWNESIPDGTLIKFQLRTGADLSSLDSGSWVGPDGTSDTFFTSSL